MSARATHARLSALKIERETLRLTNPNASLGHTGRRLDREIERLGRAA